MSSSTTTCPRCGNAASGNFCASCGAAQATRACTGCSAALAPGARFCHRCGHGAPGGLATPTVAAVTRSTTPWIVAVILTIVAVGGIVYAATRRKPATAPDMANAGNAATTPSGAVAPDISKMTPREQFDRLYDRVMTSAQGSDTAAVIRFWPMASGAYERLPDSTRDTDARFHMADLQMLVGQFPAALALADTILGSSRENLMGYYVRALVSEFQGDSTAAQAARAEFLARYPGQIEKPQLEYTHHRVMLDQYRQALGGR